MPVAKLPPVQFDFHMFWFHDFKDLRNEPGIAAGLQHMTEGYFEIADFKYEEHREHDEEQAKLELILDKHKAQVLVRDLHWLEETFEGFNLYPLSLAIAQHLYPGRKWEVLEQDFRAVVTDSERSMVFDMKNFRRLSAGASLLSVDDLVYTPTHAEIKEFHEFMNEKIERDVAVIETMRRHIEEANRGGTISPFPGSGPPNSDQ